MPILKRRSKIVKDFRHLFDEATILFQAIVLQQSGTSGEKFKTFHIKKVSIDNLNACLITTKNVVKKNLGALEKYIEQLKDHCLKTVSINEHHSSVVNKTMQLNLISDNNDIALYLVPFIDNWDLFTCAIQLLILHHTVRSINKEIQRVAIAGKIAEKIGSL